MISQYSTKWHRNSTRGLISIMTTFMPWQNWSLFWKNQSKWRRSVPELSAKDWQDSSWGWGWVVYEISIRNSDISEISLNSILWCNGLYHKEPGIWKKNSVLCCRFWRSVNEAHCPSIRVLYFKPQCSKYFVCPCKVEIASGKPNEKIASWCIVTDFSFALIHSICLGFMETTLKDYLNSTSSRTCIKICSAHLIKSWQTALKETEADKKYANLLIRMFSDVVVAETEPEYIDRCSKLLYILKSKTVTASMAKPISEFIQKPFEMKNCD